MADTPANDAAAQVSATTRQAADSRQMGWAARAGLTARAVVYLLIGSLALAVASGSGAKMDQKGALAQVLAQPFGPVMVALLAAGFVGYAAWRLTEVAFGVTGEGRAVGPRLVSLARALAYGLLAYTAVRLIQGAGADQSSQQQGYAAQLMAQPFGRWVVGLVGIAITVVGVVMVAQGVKLTFMRYFPAGSLPPRTRRTVRHLGRVGTIARGLVFTLTGVLVAAAAWTYDAAKAGGLDGALQTLRDQPFGAPLLAVVATGLIVFGVYGLFEARYRSV
ncbi:DUF1206 domain-containing protein [Pengzhenrongella phosphoraccumulans]|uniref:DUF1206 domain-containing protein n=1 Tax=Pengzhenrongella phosphoraccumulans TaxID=3114394 RepID=UPI00388DBF0C